MLWLEYNFDSGGYICAGDVEICTTEIEWNLSGPVSSSGPGLPNISLTVAGTYFLTIAIAWNAEPAYLH
ncbi:MAG TPA: hypothetical protein VFM99_09120 [Chitinophagales bacterium]|nr:hypothetical protein [Chitinophagales bacterium]